MPEERPADAPIFARAIQTQKAGPAAVDFGAPVAGDGDVSGFSILHGDSRGDVEALLADHPHRRAPGAAIDVLEFLTLPGK